MSRWFIFLITYAIMQVVAWIVTPFLPLFATQQFGPWNNGSEMRFGFRLPSWLSWFDTPDNSLDGDEAWLNAHYPVTYWSMVGWLYRNSLYGFKWSVLAAPIKDSGFWIVDGDTSIDRKTREGSLSISYIVDAHREAYWQWKWVKRIPGTRRCLMWNFGWLLDAYVKDPALHKTQPKALFQLSPRFAKYEGEMSAVSFWSTWLGKLLNLCKTLRVRIPPSPPNTP